MDDQKIKEKILILSPQKPSNPNGGAGLLYHRLKLLSKEFQLFLIAKDSNITENSNLNYFNSVRLIKKTKPTDIFNFFYRYILLTSFFAYWYVLRQKIKIIQLEFYDCLPYGLFLLPLKFLGVKFFYTAHDIKSLYYPKNSTKYLITKVIENIFLKIFIDTIFVWGEDDKNELISWKIKENKIKIIHPVFLEKGKVSWTENEKTNFVFMGSYNHAPNRDSINKIITIWPKIKEVFQESELYLILGNNVELGITDKSIINCGFVNNPLEILSKCNIFLAPIVSGTGIKVKIIESFDYGIPVISTPLGFRNFDNLDKNSVIIANDDEFLKKIQDIKNGQIKLSNISEYEKKYFEDNFSEKNILLYKKYYSQCLN